MYVLVKVWIWVRGLYKLETLGALMSFLEFCAWIVAKFLCSCLYLFDTIVQLHAIDGNHSITLSLESERNLMCNKANLIHDFCYVYVVEAFITLNRKAWYKHTSPFPNMPLVRTCLFSSVNF